MSIEAMKQEHSKRHNCPHCEREFACNHHEWVDLDDNEIQDTEHFCGDVFEFARAIEAKLKEKNT